MKNDEDNILKTFYCLRGAILLIIGLILGYIFLGKFNVYEITQAGGIDSISIWTILGGILSLLSMGWGICDIFFCDN